MIKIGMAKPGRKVFTKSLSRTLNSMNKAIEKIPGRSLQGLIQASRLIRNDMDQTPPLIPVRYGNLRRSYFSVTSTPATIRGRNPHFSSVKYKPDEKRTLEEGHAQMLKAKSAQAFRSGERSGPTVIMGFSAYYGLYVHEMVDPKVNWTRPNSGPKFFQASIRRNKKEVLRIIRDYARIPK
jgi:hypothetical protein